SFPRPPLCCAECSPWPDSRVFQKKGGEGCSRKHNIQKNPKKWEYLSGKRGVQTEYKYTTSHLSELLRASLSKISRFSSTTSRISVALGACGCTWTARKASHEG